MIPLEKIDRNFAVEKTVFKEDAVFYDVAEKPFRVYGVFYENGLYRRMPEAVAKTVSEAVYSLHVGSSGGRVRFATDSRYIGICVKMERPSSVPHSAFTGTAGFDLYIGTRYERTYIPSLTFEGGYESVAEFPEKEMRDVTINFPRSGQIQKLYIVVSNDAVVKEATPYKSEKPIVYYGSSITQGGCFSRPGLSYQAIISRRFHYDFVNLGFSGSALAEDEIAQYIKDLDMSVFVYDYDYNASQTEHLRKTHERMFKIIRQANPDLPIIIMSRPKWRWNEYETERVGIIKQTYQNAVDAGDQNVYFLDGKALMALCKDEGSVDACHPNDFGFASMASAVGDVLEGILK